MTARLRSCVSLYLCVCQAGSNFLTSGNPLPRLLSKIQYRRFLRAGHVFSCSLEFQVPTGVVISQNPAFRGSYTRDQSRWTSDEIEYVMLNKFIGLKTAVNNRVLL
jgi:hypothetical protein